MAKKWIVFVTRINARVFNAETWDSVIELKHNIGKAKNKELKTGKPGVSRGKFAGSKGIHGMTGEKNPHEDAAVEFAKKIGVYLYKQKNLHKFDDLTIVAEPKMMGRIKKQMDKHLARDVKWIGKDLGKFATHELPQFVNG